METKYYYKRSNITLHANRITTLFNNNPWLKVSRQEGVELEMVGNIFNIEHPIDVVYKARYGR